METVENQTAGFPRFPQPPGNRNHRDFHIPTARTTIPLSRTKTIARALRALAMKTNQQRKESIRSRPQRIERLSFRLIPHWNRFATSGSSRIGIELSVQAHPALDNSWE
jgi:hypothetical protein